MDIRFYLDEETGEPHVYRHGAVRKEEVRAALQASLEGGRGKEGTRVAIGQTEAGRYLRVNYLPDPDQEEVFVITTYELGPKALWALRRRLRRRR